MGIRVAAALSVVGLSESNDVVARRYDRLAPVFPLMELVFAMPPGLRRRAVEALGLRPGSDVLEIGCGSGRNLPLLVAATGPGGTVTGSDISPGMLRRAEALVGRRRWDDVVLLRQDAAELERPERYDGVLFSLAYSVMPDRHQALERAWDALRPGGTLVIFDSGSFGRLGRLLHRPSRWLSRATVLGDPAIRPWEELAVVAGATSTQLIAGTYAIVAAQKTKSPAAETPETGSGNGVG